MNIFSGVLASSPPPKVNTSDEKTAIFAGGCFWCIQADFEKMKGIITVVSGYSGGSSENPNYKNYAEGGHREVVQVTYNPLKTSYKNLVEHILWYSDPTDDAGSFHDRGVQYTPAIYYDSEEEKKVAQMVIDTFQKEKIYEKPINIALLPRTLFWMAEEYHQDYSRKNPLRYAYYRSASGRDAFISQHKPLRTEKTLPVNNYQKPSLEVLKKTLSPLEYNVTQQSGTEKPFENEYYSSQKEGIYVDKISGDPLFSSPDKYNSGTGWPSFVKPIQSNAVRLQEDKSIFSSRTEVRSSLSDSHLGHVFNDGPPDRGGKRYCMNSASLLFIPREEMEEKGYGEYLYLFL